MDGRWYGWYPGGVKYRAAKRSNFCELGAWAGVTVPVMHFKCIDDALAMHK